MKKFNIKFYNEAIILIFNGDVEAHGFKSAHSVAMEMYKQTGGKAGDVVEVASRLTGVVENG